MLDSDSKKMKKNWRKMRVGANKFWLLERKQKINKDKWSSFGWSFVGKGKEEKKNRENIRRHKEKI